MKKIMTFAALAAALILAAACAEKIESKTDGEGEVTLTLTVDAPPTKVAYDTQAGTAVWEEGDEIKLVSKNGKVITMNLEQPGSSQGVFKTTETVAAGTYIPYAISNKSKTYISVASNGDITLDLSNPDGTLQGALARDILLADPITLGASEREVAVTNLRHLLCFMKIKITGDKVDTVGLLRSGGNYEKIVLKAGYTTPDATLSGKTYRTYCAAANSQGGVSTVYLPILAESLSKPVAYAQTQEESFGLGRIGVISEKTGLALEGGEVYQKSLNLADMSYPYGTETTTNLNGETTSHQWVQLYVGGPKWSVNNLDLAQPTYETTSPIEYYTPDDPATPDVDESLKSHFAFNSIDSYETGRYGNWAANLDDDLGYRYWGGKWRIPSREQWTAITTNHAYQRYKNYVLTTDRWDYSGEWNYTDHPGNYLTAQYIGSDYSPTGQIIYMPAGGGSNSWRSNFGLRGWRTWFRAQNRWYIVSDYGDNPAMDNHADASWATMMKFVYED